MKALIIVDMLEDFVGGALANPRAQAIVAPLRRLLDHARKEGWVVVFSSRSRAGWAACGRSRSAATR